MLVFCRKIEEFGNRTWKRKRKKSWKQKDEEHVRELTRKAVAVMGHIWSTGERNFSGD